MIEQYSSFLFIFYDNCQQDFFCLEWLTVQLLCSSGPMDKTAVSGAADTGSIPVWSTIIFSRYHTIPKRLVYKAFSVMQFLDYHAFYMFFLKSVRLLLGFNAIKQFQRNFFQIYKGVIAYLGN